MSTSIHRFIPFSVQEALTNYYQREEKLFPVPQSAEALQRTLKTIEIPSTLRQSPRETGDLYLILTIKELLNQLKLEQRKTPGLSLKSQEALNQLETYFVSHTLFSHLTDKIKELMALMREKVENQIEISDEKAIIPLLELEINLWEISIEACSFEIEQLRDKITKLQSEQTETSEEKAKEKLQHKIGSKELRLERTENLLRSFEKEFTSARNKLENYLQYYQTCAQSSSREETKTSLMLCSPSEHPTFSHLPKTVEVWDFVADFLHLVLPETPFFEPSIEARQCYATAESLRHFWEAFRNTLSLTFISTDYAELLPTKEEGYQKIVLCPFHLLNEAVLYRSDICIGDWDPHIFNKDVATRSDIVTYLFSVSCFKIFASRFLLQTSIETQAIFLSFYDIITITAKHYYTRTKADDPTASWSIGENWIKNADGSFSSLRSLKTPGAAYRNHFALGSDPQIRHIRNITEEMKQDPIEGPYAIAGIINHVFYLIASQIGGDSWNIPCKIWFDFKTYGQEESLNQISSIRTFAQNIYSKADSFYATVEHDPRLGDIVKQAWSTVGIEVE